MSDDNKDAELLTLLDLNGHSFWRNEKYWIKFVAKRVKKDEHRPHGIKYSITLHDRNNTRILGFDNAHNIRKRGRRPVKFNGRIVTWDHIHKENKVERYLFTSASELINDFWKAVDEITNN